LLSAFSVCADTGNWLPTLMYCPPNGTIHCPLTSTIWITDTPNATPRRPSASTEYTPLVALAVAMTYPALRPVLATPSNGTNVQSSAPIVEASPLAPVKRKTTSVRADRAGSAVYVPSDDPCSTREDTTIRQPPDDVASDSCGGSTNRIPPNRMYSMVVVSRVSTRVLASASMAPVDTELALTNAALAVGSSFTSVYWAVNSASTPEN
jgi:hypothetical protein